MISGAREILRFFDQYTINLWTIILLYFWSVWSIKLICSLRYKPVDSDFNTTVSVIIPTYHEDEKILTEAISKILKYPKEIVSEVIIVTDVRESELPKKLEMKYSNEDRMHIIQSPPGKREALDLGIRRSTNDIIITMDSDTYLDEKTIPEIIKPFIDKNIGGVVSDQRIYNPYGNVVNFFNTLVEGVKYKITVPTLSIFGNVTVLAGRCVAYRRNVVVSVLPELINEKFLGKKCISGDDGRLTSLVLKAGWKTVYQSTAIVYTVSPPTWSSLIRQRIRWNRNTSRRTIRALLCFDGRWVWKRPVATLHMIFNWTGAIMVGLAIYALTLSIYTGLWFWFGYTLYDTFLRLGIFMTGITLTRFVRISPILKYHHTRKWVWFPLFPMYLIVMWMARIYAIFTMNKQGWITRKYSGAGGFCVKKS